MHSNLLKTSTMQLRTTPTMHATHLLTNKRNNCQITEGTHVPRRPRWLCITTVVLCSNCKKSVCSNQGRGKSGGIVGGREVNRRCTLGKCQTSLLQNKKLKLKLKLKSTSGFTVEKLSIVKHLNSSTGQKSKSTVD